MTLRARLGSLLPIGLMATALLVACGGGGSASGGSGVLPGSAGAPTVTPGAAANATIELVIPAVAQLSGTIRRRPHFVSPSTQSALVVAGKPGATPQQTVVNLSSSASGCSVQNGNRVCTTTVQMPFGATTIAVTTYDQPPLNKTIPANAHMLGTGMFTIAPSALAEPIVIAIDAVVGGFGTLPSFASLPADGAVHTYGFVLNPTDFDDNSIVNGAPDPYANPITVTLTESGGSGHSHLVLDGNASGNSAVLSSSSDTIAVQYDGGGAPGYSIVANFSATGVTDLSTTVAPLFVSAFSLTANAGYTAPNITLAGVGTRVTFEIAESGAPAATVYTASPAGCGSVATVSAVMPVGSGVGFTVNGTSTTGSCSVQVSDGTSTIQLGVFNGVPTPAPTASPSAAPTASPSAAPTTSPSTAPTTPPTPYIYVNTGGINGPIAAFPVSSLLAYPTLTNIAPLTSLTSSDVIEGSPSLAYDSTNNLLWMIAGSIISYPLGETGTSIAPSHTIPPGNLANFVAVDNSGNLYVEEGGYPHVYVYMFADGASTPGTTFTTSLTIPGGIAVDSNKNIYVSDVATGTINVYANPGFTAGNIFGSPPTRTITTTFAGMSQIALDSANRIYALDNAAPQVQIFAAGTTNLASEVPLETISGAAIRFQSSTSPVYPSALTVDASGNLYVTDALDVDMFSAAAINGALGGTLTTPSSRLSGVLTQIGGAAGIAVP
jgi:hypothetical protein